MAKKAGPPKIDFDELDQQPASGILLAPGGMLGEQRSATPGQRVIQEIPVDLIDPNPHQARKRFDPQTINELANSMRAHGFTTVVWVRRHPHVLGRYQLVYGERRLRAAKLVAADPEPRFRVIPCEVVEAPEARMKELGLLENIQREDLLPEEEARGFRDLLDLTLDSGERPYSIRKLAKQLAKDESYIQDRLFLLEMPDDVKALYDQVPEIALRTLREVCNIPTAAARRPILERIRIERMAFAKVREVVQAVLEDLEAASAAEQGNGHIKGTAVPTSPAALGTPIQQAGESPADSPAGEDRRGAETDQAETVVAPMAAAPSPGPKHEAPAPLAVYTGLLRRDTKVIFPILDGWEKLLVEADVEVKRLVAATLEQVVARCSQLQELLQSTQEGV